MPVLVITEVAYLIQTRLGTEAEVRFLADLAEGTLIAEPVAAADWLRIAELVATYRDLPLGTVDASVIAAADCTRPVAPQGNSPSSASTATPRGCA